MSDSALARIRRVVFDSTALLGGDRGWLIAGAHLKYYEAYWSPWIVAEFARRRTEWIAYRAIREGSIDKVELRRRLHASRSKVNSFIREVSMTLQSVDYERAPDVDLSWIKDPDDIPVMRTALVAEADVLVTDNRRDFPLDTVQHGVHIVSAEQFREELFTLHPTAEADITDYLEIYSSLP